MRTKEQLARFIAELEETGFDLDHAAMSDDGVFFKSEKAARIFSEKYDKELVQIGGWLAKNRDTTGLGAVT